MCSIKFYIYKLLIRESIFVGWGFSFLIVLVPRYKLSLCHTPIKPDLLGFPGTGIFACGLRDDCASKVSLSLLFYICIYCFYLGFL